MEKEVQERMLLQERLLQTGQRFGKLHFANLLEGMSKGEFFLLCRIENGPADAGCVGVGELAKSSKVKMPAVSRMLNGLEKKGWIGREADPSDRRNVRIHLTEEGKERLKEQKNRLSGFLDRVLAQMGENDALHLIDLCSQLADIMENELTAKKERDNG